ncbi:DJ-1/PfpI family protein [Actinoplanes sp. HUAS TT8]|uniref:DJ-1/PfpI family protein n=1 Tax=Actinoplanes sp. HUAS TT8 TaxID=3447453 RepID=UPI003F52105F
MMRLLLRVLLALAVPSALLGAGFMVTMSRDFSPLGAAAEPSGVRDARMNQLKVAILLSPNGSVATDVLGPYDVLADSSRFDVYTVSTSTDPVALSGGLTALPDFTVTTAPTPDIVVVPAWTDPGGADEAPLRALIEHVHDTGGLVVSVCAGARVLAATDVLDGRRATSFWSDIPGLRTSHRETTWLAGTRWVEDGDVLTTAGVSSGILGALHLVERFAGPAEATRIADRINYPDQTSTTIPERRVSAGDYPYALNAVLPWFQPTYGLGLTDGVTEIDIAAAAELYGGVAFTAHVVPVAATPIVTTAHGLRLVAHPIGTVSGLDRLVVPGVTSTTLGGAPLFLPRAAARPGDSAFDPILRDIARTDGRATARTAAKYIEYPTPELPGSGVPGRIIVLIGLLTALGVAIGVGPRRLVGNRLHKRRAGLVYSSGAGDPPIT